MMQMFLNLFACCTMPIRRVSATLYKKNLRWRKAVDLAKADKLYKDAMETTAGSGDQVMK